MSKDRLLSAFKEPESWKKPKQSLLKIFWLLPLSIYYYQQSDR